MMIVCYDDHINIIRQIQSVFDLSNDECYRKHEYYGVCVSNYKKIK